MRSLCYVIGFVIAAAVAIIPWVVGHISPITVIVSAAGIAMIVLLIIGLAKGWPCLFGGNDTSTANN